MIDKLQKLQDRIEELLKVVDSLRKENHALKADAKAQTAELAKLRDHVDSLKREQADQSEAVKSKLNSMLSRLDELESLTE
jgi:predicted RNase H-like nuclease (RuvC/YqgF family)